ncbi:aryl-alcohol dehydrogenase-like predicted oxidoreductase [Branchiibius hedensis]|uniref:Predicted oxidoreductase n=1 Tax=Branchiibius hedensis TaxID=672460 RepID=A0A2Y8ZZA3_9MICO|nr:aryl-alcohol dehydrogenase-like predicted oxidoreductase [Branchiibius hedensis]SSA35579.1 Predicted oxidoreductase [Branchiibius hedensis]
MNAAAAGDFELAGRPVNRIGFGAMQLPGPGVFGPPKNKDAAIAVLRRAVELGVNHIDTAQFYGPDVSNELIREALHPYSEDLSIVTKVGARRDGEGNWVPAQTPQELRDDVEANLRTLGLEQIAAVNLRRMDEHEGHDVVPIEDQLSELAALRDEGKIGGIGVSTVDLDTVNLAIAEAEITCVQNAFSLVDQSDAPVLERCAAAGIAYVPYFPLGSAFPNMPKVVDDARVQEIAAAHGVSPAQIGLAWLLARSPNILLIPGTSSVAHLEENLAVGAITLTKEQLSVLAG